jgi:uncharacterized membrane protein
MKSLGIAVSTVALSLATLPAWAQQSGDASNPPASPYPHGGMMGGGGWGYHHHMLFFHPFLTVLAVILMIAVFRRLWWHHRGYGRWHHAGAGTGSPALGILEERFVKGEIPKEEFEEKRKALRRRCF